MENLLASFEDLLAGTLVGMSALGIVLLSAAVLIVGLLVVYFIRIHIAYRMAVNRHRDPLGWALLSFFVSPLLTWVILLIAGDAK